jgi:hypothetical protein
LHRSPGRLRVQGDLAAGQRGGQVAKNQVGVGHGRLAAALAVGHPARVRASRLRPDPQGPGQFGNVGDRAAARPDRPHIDRGGAHRQVADLGLPAHPRPEVLNQGDVRRRTAHVEGQQVAVTRLLGYPDRPGHSPGGAGQQHRDRRPDCGAGHGEAAVAAQDGQRGLHPLRRELAPEIGHVAGDLGLDVAVAAVVSARSYSRSSGSTALDSETGTADSCPAASSPTRRLCASLAKPLIKEMASASIPAARSQKRCAPSSASTRHRPRSFSASPSPRCSPRPDFPELPLRRTSRRPSR